ncbi:MAG: hypothetical protein M1492_02785 [Gammaproteobacteria bacterium]|nr:hypothetical protein [Gammaproteobacteria bacterium]
MSALRRDHARGVKVQTILDQYPYGIKPWMVRREAWAVRETGASLHWAPARFAATPPKNREYLEVTTTPAIVKSAQMVFDVGVHHPSIACADLRLDLPHGLVGRASGAEPVTAGVEVRFPFGADDLRDGLAS